MVALLLDDDVEDDVVIKDDGKVLSPGELVDF